MCITFFCLNPFKANQIYQAQINQPGSYGYNKNPQKIKISDKDNIETNHFIEMEDQKLKKSVNKQRGQVQFVIAFNRDQKSHRKTKKIAPFEEDPNIYAGRDVISTGTWLGVNIKTGIMVILTNYDIPHYRKGKSRGQLVKSFLSTSFVPTQLHNDSKAIDTLIKGRLEEILKQCLEAKYCAFNLTIYNIRTEQIFYICSQLKMESPTILKKGETYGICNSDIFTHVPKIKHGLKLFKKTLSGFEEETDEEIFKRLMDGVMKDKKQFSPDINDESSIFLQPFDSTLRKAETMTKSTFMAIVRKKELSNGESQIQLIMRQVTHQNKKLKEKSCNNFHDKIYNPERKGEQHDNDHWSETTVDLKIKI